MGVQLTDIDYFLAVAAEGQVRRAAAQLGVSQPALTKGLQRLEKTLGFELFERLPRGMSLTRVGEQFRQRTQALRGTLADAIKEATDMHLGSMGLLRVGLSPLYAQQLFVPAYVRLHAQRPAATVRVAIQLNDELWRSLRQGDLDLTISSLPAVVPDDLSTLRLMDDDLWMVVREDHPLLQRKRLTLKDLSSAQWMLPGAQVAARRSVEARLTEANLPPPKVVMEISSTAGQLSRILLQSDLVSLMSDSMLQGPAGQGLARLPMTAARFSRAIGITTLRDVPLPPLGQRFVELLQAREQPARKSRGRG